MKVSIISGGSNIDWDNKTKNLHLQSKDNPGIFYGVIINITYFMRISWGVSVKSHQRIMEIFIVCTPM